MYIIETNLLSFKYSKKVVLEKLNLTVQLGSIYGFLGKNGAGKTTTLKLLLGLFKNYNGNISLFGKDIESHRRSILIKVGSFIEHPSFYGHLTILENLKYLDLIFNKGNNHIGYLLRLVNLLKDKNVKGKNCSKGMKQRLGIAVALFNNPELLLLDEPFNGLDPENIYDLRNTFIDINKKGVTIVFSSHIMSEVENTCTHIGILNNGKLIFQGEKDRLLNYSNRQMIINTNNNEKSIKLCRDNKFEASEYKRNTLSVDISKKEEFNQILSIFINNNISIYDIELKSKSLESIFINLVNNEAIL